jgi:hypothetical protein
MGTTSGWPPALKGDFNPRLCSAAESPLSVKVRLGDAAVPVSCTVRVPVAVTLTFGPRVPLSVIFPSLRESLTLVLCVEGTLIRRALGLADVEPPANDHCNA